MKIKWYMNNGQELAWVEMTSDQYQDMKESLRLNAWFQVPNAKNPNTKIIINSSAVSFYEIEE